jgi:murein DD-endopeptidase MepM/ murein hydrolase activator NlpD
MAKKESIRHEALEICTRKSTIVFAVCGILFSALFVASPAVKALVPELGSGGPEINLEESFPGEQAPEDRGLYYTVYLVRSGDTISELAQEFNVTEDTIISFNDIKSSRSMQVGTYLKIPSSNGLLYIASSDDLVATLAEKYEISAERIKEFNGLEGEELAEGQMVFLPDARMSRFELQEINGDLFLYPVRGYITSWYGYRNDPFTGARSFHNGLDIGAAYGTPIRAAMDGVVIATGYNGSAGNYVVIAHHSGYSTTYMHMSAIWVKTGAYVTTMTNIGAIGSTGKSTGPHVHFMVKKNGRTINPVPVLH